MASTQVFNGDIVVGGNLSASGITYDNSEIKVSASDTTVTLDTSSKETQIVTGTGILYVIDLGVATTYSAPKLFRIINSTPEFVGVKNSNGTVWHRVPPRATFTAYLVDNSTAAGVWSDSVFDPATVDPGYGFNAKIDFTGLYSTSNYFSEAGLYAAVSGTGAAANVSTTAIAGGIQGVCNLTTGTTTTGYALLHGPGTSINLGGGCKALEARLSLSAISSAANEYIFRFGFGNALDGTSHTEGAYFLYDRYNGGGDEKTNLQIKTIATAGGAGGSVADSGTAPVYGTTGAEWQKLRVEIASDASRADFWIDKALINVVGGVTGLPLTSTSIKYCVIGITKTEDAGTTARYVKIDDIWIQLYPTTKR